MVKEEKPQIAIVHDYLRTFGGGERVLWEIHNMWPKAKIYVATASYKRMGRFANRFKGLNIETSWAQKVPLFAYYPLLYRYLLPYIWPKSKINNMDIIISSSGSNISKAVKVPSGCVHICYCHTPPRFLYDISNETTFISLPIIRTLLRPLNNILRMFDYNSNKGVDIFISNSKTVKDRIQKIYNRDSYVLYPPCNIPNKAPTVYNMGYYLVVSRLVKYKNINLIVEAFKILGFPLKIVGTGKEMGKLVQLAQNYNNIEFLGEISDKMLVYYYKNAKALVTATTDEDFGMTIPEAAGYGKPTIAYYSGGHRETVLQGKTGLFFYKLNSNEIVKTVRIFEKTKFNPTYIWNYSKKFSIENFKQGLKLILKKSYKYNR